MKSNHYSIIVSVADIESLSYDIRDIRTANSLPAAMVIFMRCNTAALRLIISGAAVAAYVSIHENGTKIINRVRITNE